MNDGAVVGGLRGRVMSDMKGMLCVVCGVLCGVREGRGCRRDGLLTWTGATPNVANAVPTSRTKKTLFNISDAVVHRGTGL